MINNNCDEYKSGNKLNMIMIIIIVVVATVKIMMMIL